MLCGDIRTEMVEYEICFLTMAPSHFGVHFGHVVRTEVDVLNTQVPLVIAFVLGNFCNYRHKSYISEN